MKLNVVELAQSKDFKADVFKGLKSVLGNIEVLYSNVLVATFVEPEKTKGGIIRPNKSIEEARFQGKIGLVLKLGANAFKYDGAYSHEGPAPDVGDWVMYHASDSRELALKGFSCRLIDSSLIRMIISDPEDVY